MDALSVGHPNFFTSGNKGHPSEKKFAEKFARLLINFLTLKRFVHDEKLLQGE